MNESANLNNSKVAFDSGALDSYIVPIETPLFPEFALDGELNQTVVSYSGSLLSLLLSEPI